MPRLPIYRDMPDGVVYSNSQYPEFDPATRIRNRGRIRIFLSAVAVSSLISLSYTFLRPAIYESHATLLVTPPVINERMGETSNAQHVRLQLQSLTSHGLLSRVLEEVSASGSLLDTSGLTLPVLQGMLSAVSVDNTHLIALTAEGPDKELLPVVLNTWVEVYQGAHRDAIEAESSSATLEIDQQLVELQQKVTEKRQALDRFRRESDIVSMERNENRILRKLSGLTDSLNKANEEKVTTQARLAAIRTAIAQGRPIANSHGQDSLTNLEQRLVEIEEGLKELEHEFTPRYMSVDPQIKALVRKRELLEAKIRNNRRESKQIALAGAEQDLASARQAVASLQRQLDEQKQQVMEFTTRFAEHEALQEELLQLETASRETQDQQLQLQVNKRRQFPQVEIRERSFLPERPIHPDYLRDAAISLAVSVVVGLLLLWLYDFLTRPARHAGTHEFKQVFVTSPETRVLARGADERLSQSPEGLALEHQLPRELSQAEVLELLQVAGPDVRLLVVCLLSGLSAEEVRVLQRGDIDTDAGVVHVRGESGRTIPVTPSFIASIGEWMPKDPDATAPVWQDASGKPLALDDIAAMLLFTAHDAGLTRPPDITPESIRHTYIAYLVRQGVRLNDLPGLVGQMPPGMLAAYGVHSPPGSAVPLASVGSVYPALEIFYQKPSNAGSAPDPGQSA
jgi:succinoglycan biosynthesis transport protein ExoP